MFVNAVVSRAGLGRAPVPDLDPHAHVDLHACCERLMRLARKVMRYYTDSLLCKTYVAWVNLRDMWLQGRGELRRQ